MARGYGPHYLNMIYTTEYCNKLTLLCLRICLPGARSKEDEACHDVTHCACTSLRGLLINYIIHIVK